MLSQEDHQESALPKNIWLVTFADVIALLLAFFVMLFSMNSIKTEPWEAITTQNSSSDMVKQQDKSREQAAKIVTTVKLNEGLSLQYLANVLEEHLSEDRLLKAAVVHRLDGLVVVSLPSDAMFGVGSVELTDGAREAVFKMGGIIATIKNHIDVRGHTDPSSNSDMQFNSKWLVSLARAAAVANELKRTGYGRQIPIFGLADTRYAHLDGRIPKAERLALSRRVDVFIHPHSGEI